MVEAQTDAAGLTPIRHQSLADRVLAELRHSILTGTLAPGEQLSIVDIAERFGVSHIPVREAMRRLDSQGLLVLRRGKSATVPAVSQADLSSIYRLRALIEVDLAVRSAPLLTEKDLADADSFLGEYALSGLPPAAVSQAHHSFHLSLLRPAATDWDHRLLQQLWDASSRYLYLVIDRLDGAQRPGTTRVALHEEVLEAVRSLDAALIRRVWKRHLQESAEMLGGGLALQTATPASEQW